MKALGIVLSAGTSSRLYPATLVTTKQLLPVYDKPLVFYPLSILMLGGVKDINIITNVTESATYTKLFKKAQLKDALNLTYLPQYAPNGIPEAFKIVADEFDQEYLDQYDKIALILGDNIFHGSGMTGHIMSALDSPLDHAQIFVTKVNDPTRFGVAEIEYGKILSITEKPAKIETPSITYAITGLYVFPKDVFHMAKQLKKSARGETEITDLIKAYEEDGRLQATILQRGISWFDTGTPDSLLDAANYIRAIQTYQGQLVGSPHEVALRRDWMSDEKIREYLELDTKSDYAKKLKEYLELNRP